MDGVLNVALTVQDVEKMQVFVAGQCETPGTPPIS